MTKSVVIIGTRGYPSYYGGFETAVRKLAPFLVEAGWDVTVYGRRGSTVDADPARDTRVNTIVTGGFETKSVSTLSYGFTASLHAARAKPDVALVMNVANGYFLPLLKARGIPTLVNVDGIEWEREKWGRLAKSVFHTGAKLSSRFGNRLIFDSKALGARWGRDFNVGGEFIPYGGDIPTVLPVEPGLTHRGYVLVVARFVPENTIAEFFDAIDELPAGTPVVIVGSSGYLGEFDQRAAAIASRSPSVQWLGHLSDDQRLLSLWQHAGVYFHGHSVGGTNPALVQAMAASAPILARDTVYNREVLGNDGHFVAPDAAAIAAALASMLADRDLLESSSTANLLRAQSHYSWLSVCNGYLEALEALHRNSAELPGTNRRPALRIRH